MITEKKKAYPTPPSGYHPPIPFEYPRNKLQIIAIGLLLVMMPILLILTWLLQGQPAGLPFLARMESLEFLLILGTIIVTVIVHELIHGITYQLFGYRVTYGANLRLFAAYAGAFKQWQQRNHNIVVALAPLCILTLLLVPLLTASQPMLILIIFTALLFNTGGAVGDLYLTWRLLRLPSTTLIYDIDVETMLLFLPIIEE